MTSVPTLTALHQPSRRRRPGLGLIHHSNQGSQYTGGDSQTVLGAHQLLPSMNGVGTWYDTAPTETFFATLKGELVHHRLYRTSGDASPGALERLCRSQVKPGLAPRPQG